MTFKQETISLLESIREELTEKQKHIPSLGGVSDKDGKASRKGAFKVPTSALKFWANEIPGGPDEMLFKKVRDYIYKIPRQDLPAFWGSDNMPDAQDYIAGKPRKAFKDWMRNLNKDTKLKKYIKSAPDNVPLIYYAFMQRVSGKDMAKQIFKRYFETQSDHYGAAKAKVKKESVELEEMIQGAKLKGAKEITKEMKAKTSTAKDFKKYINSFNNAEFLGRQTSYGKGQMAFKATNAIAKTVAKETGYDLELVDAQKSVWLAAKNRKGTKVKS